ncbi:hypothetical protein I6U52_20985 [Serratia marcescens]|nr:hypothetical protein [Serratia marcescens]MBH2865784.1 hypothetical protein [Serratia marcescens]MBW4239718.1 hypothetical protein [Enterobacter roggenkampii]
MGGKKIVDMTSMYRALKELGHNRIWLRIISSDDRFMMTFENRCLARFDRDLRTWRFVKDADLVDDWPVGNPPDGEGLTELYEEDEILFYLTMEYG